MISRGSLGIALGIAVEALASTAGAESGLRLPYPSHFGAIPAATYDTDGKRVGAADLRVERLENGNVRIVSESGIEDGARTAAVALLAPIDSGKALQLLTQESRSIDERGASLGVLRTSSCPIAIGWPTSPSACSSFPWRGGVARPGNSSSSRAAAHLVSWISRPAWRPATGRTRTW